ncbi:MAG: hypothetical protein ACLGG0_01575 [Bacteriovoracia bacterium]
MIDLPAISEEEITSQQLPMSDLWMVKLNEEVFGPYSTAMLKSYAAEHAPIMAEADVSNMETEEWVMYLQSPLKPQKAKEPPKLVSAQTLQTYNSYYLEHHGQRVGPTTHAEMVEKVKKGEVLATDLISYDEGMTWHKVFELKEFEVRPHQSEQLPAAPFEETFLRGHAEALKTLMEEEDPVKVGLVSLGHFAHRKQHSTGLRIEEVALPKEVALPVKIHVPKNWWIGGGAAATAALALMIWWSNAPTSLDVQMVESDVTTTEFMEPGTSLLNETPAKKRTRRAPASVRPMRVESPPAMRDTRADLADYRETHDMNRDQYEPAEPMDVDPYGADAQVVQDDRSESIIRRPSATEAPDDGYRMEEPTANESGPIVEEVGDF